MNSIASWILIPIQIIKYAATLSGQAVHRAFQDDVSNTIEAAQTAGLPAAEIVANVWRAAHLTGEPRPIAPPRYQDCPFIARHPQLGWFVVLAQTADDDWNVRDAEGKVSKINLEGADCVSVPGRSETVEKPESSAHLVGAAIWKRKSVFIECLLATFLVNFLTMAASLYSMQVYDRVIPNSGFQTLFVLTTGAMIVVMLELLIKQVRSYTMDKAETIIDQEISAWFFTRALGIHLDFRPPSVGTLAAQIRGYESIRAVLSSTTIFILVDIPFALIFVAVIAFIGGWLAIVPLVLIPLSLISGLIFQKLITRATRENQLQNNSMVGLLVETIDGAESLKANGAEWKIQGRWSEMLGKAATSNERVKIFSTLSQNMTSTLQQLGYISLVALGAYLVTSNLLTMGALIACSIISNRALSPIIQLPAVMVKITQARIAAEGLDRIITLPNELDDVAHTIVPGKIESGLRFEQAKYVYGNAERISLEIPTLVIKQGERVGVLGSIGSGKSTLLKLASGLYRPREGRVFLGDLDMNLLAPQVLRETIAYLPQDLRLISGTLRDNLLQGLADPGDELILETARKTGLIDLITNHPNGLALPITEGGRGISGGQRQLIGLTRMVLAKPTLLILDEPTASMDSTTEAKVVALLGEMSAAGVTMLIATHKTALLPVIDRLLVLHGGKFIVDGPRDLVMAKLQGTGNTAG